MGGRRNSPSLSLELEQSASESPRVNIDSHVDLGCQLEDADDEIDLCWSFILFYLKILHLEGPLLASIQAIPRGCAYTLILPLAHEKSGFAHRSRGFDLNEILDRLEDPRNTTMQDGEATEAINLQILS